MRLFADYRQIHVLAPGSKTSLEEAWTAQATDDRIAAAGDIVGIGTERADDVDVTVEILKAEPKLEAGEHVTEATLRLDGEVAVMGCTDELARAKRFKTPAGLWCLRATHTNLAKREKIKLQLWPASSAPSGATKKTAAKKTAAKKIAAKKIAAPRVLTRYVSPAPKAKAKAAVAKAPTNLKQACAAALGGNAAVALEVLLRLHGEGDAAAAAAAAQILAFQGKWKEAAVCAKALLANPDAVYASNVLDDMELVIEVAQKGLPKPMPADAPNRERYDLAVKEASTGKRFKGKPEALAQHCFSLAVVFHVDDEIIARWDPKHPTLHFGAAADAARALVRRGDKAGAWKVLESRLGRWYPVDAAQVLPMELVTDPLLAPLLTPERRAQVLSTPRAVG